MRFFHFALLFLLVSCGNRTHQPTGNIDPTDTAKLFDPYPGNDSIATEVVLCNCLMLDNNKATAGIECEKMEFGNDREIQELLQQRSDAIRKKKFYIVYAPNTSMKRILDVVNMIKAADIPNYKVIELRSVMKILEMNK